MNGTATSSRIRLARLFAGAMILVGIYAIARYGGEWAYAMGRFVGSH